MPKKEHDRLVREANAKGLKGEAKDRYVFGTLARIAEARKAKEQREKRRKHG